MTRADRTPRTTFTTRAERRAHQQRLQGRRSWLRGATASVMAMALVLGGTSLAFASTSSPAPEPETTVSVPDASESSTPTGDTDAAVVEEVAEDGAAVDEAIDVAVEETVAPDEASKQAPAAVAAGEATLRVKKLGERTSDGGVTSLEGATFYAIAAAANDQPSIDETSDYSCTTGVDGLCNIEVPAISGGTGLSTNGYWIVEGSTTSNGYTRITAIGTGQHTDAKTDSAYMFFTGTVKDGDLVEVTAETFAFANPQTGSTTATTKAGGVVNSRSNTALPESCGLSIALVLDLSQSIDNTKMKQLKAAASSFVGDDGLGGTASSVSVYGFGTNAGQLLPSTSLQTSGGQDVVNDVINALPSNGSGFTNWDDAFQKVAFNAFDEQYDLVLFLSDGDPTTYGTNGSSNIDTNVSFRNVEEGALSANTVKGLTGPAGDNTKVVGVGIGMTSNSYLNLAAVSGPTQDEDYYLTDFPGLSEKLREIATKNCGGTLTVIKKTVDAEDHTISETTSGWAFTGTTEGDWIAGPDGLTDELTLTTGDSGSVNFPLDFAGDEGARAITVTEDQQAGWTPTDVVCDDDIEPSGDAASFTVDVPVNGIVVCTVTNQSGGGGGGDVGIEKTAEIDGAPVTEPLESGDAFDYVLEVTNYGPDAASDLVVTDAIPSRLTVTGITIPAGWTNDNAPEFVGEGNVVSVSGDTLAVDDTVEIVVSVVVNAAAPAPELSLLNEACVTAAVDADASNNCDSVIVTVLDPTPPPTPTPTPTHSGSLPATGAPDMGLFVGLGFAALIAGIVAMAIVRRRRETTESK